MINHNMIKKYFLRSLFTLLIIIVLTSQTYASEYQHFQKKSAKQALAEMLSKTKDPFLIIEISGSKKYIQFYNYNPGLMLDLPVISLTEKETKLATAYFSEKGINPVNNKARDPDTEKEFVLMGWRHIYNPDEIDKVVDIAFGALFEIYGISNKTPLSFIKGWE